MLDSTRFIDEKIPSSITSLDNSTTLIDQQAPLSFIEWLKYNNSLFTNADDFLVRYQSYLNNWYEIKGKSVVDVSDLIKKTYADLINEIIVSYASSEEKRFLKNLDLNNNRDLAIAVPFFAQKIKDICLYYSTLRDDVKTSQLRYNLKGSNFGVEKIVYNEISKSLETDDLTDFVRTLSLSLSDVRNNLVVNIEDIFDTYSYYLDTSTTQSPSSYNITNGQRKEYFNYNSYDIDPDLFLNFDSAIVKAIKSYAFFLNELGINNFVVDVTPESSQLNLLKDRDYINTVNTETVENLNLNLKKSEIEKFIGTDYFYLSTGNTSSDVVSGVLFSPVNDFANYLNKRYPSVAAIPSLQFLKTAKEIGLFFKPDKIGLSTFLNFNNSYKLKALSANTLYIFPNPNKLGNVTGLSNDEFISPFEFIDNVYDLKIDFSNQYQFGDSLSNPYLQTFRAYQSREQTNNISLQGLARYTDSQDFFKGEFRSIWANEDVFPLVPQNLFPLDNRISKLYSLDKTMVQYKSDVYGNEFCLYKDVFPKKIVSENAIRQEGDGIKYCQVFNGHLFFDPISGFYFDYYSYDPDRGYSGILLRTSIQIPPGSGYFTHGPNLTSLSPLSAQYYNNGVPTFSLTGSPVPIISYRLQPETFCSSYSNTIYLCESLDGVNFIGLDGTLLPDVPSDNPIYDPNLDNLYYTDLVDGGMSPTGPNYRANFSNPPVFYYLPPTSGYEIKNGFVYLVNNSEPCGTNNLTRNINYAETNPYLNYRVPFRRTAIADPGPSLQVKRPLYDTKFIDFGELYYRNSNSSITAPASSALSAIYTKYNTFINNELNKKLINFDLYYDVIQFETENYLIFDKILFDYDINLPTGTTKADSYFTKGSNKKFEHFSTVWFNEKTNKIYFCKTILYPTLSATNSKIIYPEIYEVDINTLNFLKIYPLDKPDALTFDKLIQFSLLSKNIDLNIVEIEKPLLTYDDETANYVITYLGKDLSNVFYIFKTYFKYVNGAITNINTHMYLLDQNVLSINFANISPPPQYNVFNIRGSSASSIVNGAFVFGA